MQVVVATAGHVDHGKSTLVRALTGMEPDRWAEERRRGMTIDLGFAWTGLPGDRTIAFVDVPGHERFIGNMLAGLGPAPAVMMVVAADQGWQAQSDEHLAAIDALGLRHGLLVITRTDLADPAASTFQALQHLSSTGLRDIPLVSVSGRTGDGIPELREALQRLAEVLPVPDPLARLRMWVDRAFTIRGSGTVVTGTLAEGTITVGDELNLGERRVRVRALQSLGEPVERIAGVARVAVNLRDVHPDEIRRGDVLIRTGEWARSRSVDVHASGPLDRIPQVLHLHVGTSSHPVRVRPLAGSALRLSLPVPLPLRAGDRAILRDPGGTVLTGITVLDVDPPPLRRRGAAANRAAELGEPSVAVDPAEQVIRRGALAAAAADRAGIDPSGDPRVLRVAGWWIAKTQWQRWESALVGAVDRRAEDHPLDPSLPAEDARRVVELPASELLLPLVEAAGLITEVGRVHRPGVGPSLGAAADAVRMIESRLRDSPFAAPDLEELAALRLGVGELRAAESLGRVIALPGRVVLLPDGPARAMRVLAGLPSPFTLSQARQALGATRRVAVPLLEYLDQRGWTRRIDGDRREIRR